MTKRSKEELGGKGAGLAALQEAGFEVPKFLVLPVSFFEKYGLEDRDLLIRACEELMPEWQVFFGQSLLAVRSSAVAEDSAQHSYAGQFTSLLNVPLQDATAAVAEVWASAQNTQAYAKAHGIHTTPGMAVILQQMVPATAAGVAFSAHPVNGTTEQVVNAVTGLGDRLVDGSATADSYIVLDGEVVQRKIIDQTPVLKDALVLEVAAAALRAAKTFGAPQDIEFAFEGQQLYVLQSRPISTLPATQTVWDNSNIVESYPGQTLPLTFSFIEKMYAAVYRQFCAALGVRLAKIRRHDRAFDNMLGLLNGRVYYNLNSWYEALALLPGYSINAAFMEGMMGVRDKPDIQVTPERSGAVKAWLDVARAVGAIGKNLVRARKSARSFKQAFERIYQGYEGIDFAAQPAEITWRQYEEFETYMLREWKAPVVNDFFAMIYFGLLQKLCTTANTEDKNLHNRLLADAQNVLTVQPMKELPRIAALLSQDPALHKLANNATPAQLYAAMQEREHAKVYQAFTDYIRRWGERAVAELKLETITYREDPLALVRLLQGYVKGGMRTEIAVEEGGRNAAEAEQEVARALKGKWLKKRLFKHVLRQARYFVAERENLRYYRTRGFGMVRRMMLGIGHQLANEGILEKAQDVFWLELEEVDSISKKSQPMKITIAGRKAHYAAALAQPLPQRVASYGVPRGIIERKATAPVSRTADQLKGTPCSAGIVRQRVRLVSHASDLNALDGAILATYATDPGYVVLFATTSGILTERGSLLSHAAIVSREMKIPCIVGIDGLMSTLEDGDLVEMNGATGQVHILERAKPTTDTTTS